MKRLRRRHALDQNVDVKWEIVKGNLSDEAVVIDN